MSNVQKKLNINLNLFNNDTSKDTIIRKNLSAKKFLQDEFSNNNKNENEKEGAGKPCANSAMNTPKQERLAKTKDKLDKLNKLENYDLEKNIDLILDSGFNKNKPRVSLFKKRSSFKLEDIFVQLNNNNIEFPPSIEENNNNFNNPNSFNKNANGFDLKDSEIVFTSENTSFKMGECDPPRKKSYIEDLPKLKPNKKFSSPLTVPILMPNSLILCEDMRENIENKIDASMQNIATYYEYTFECMKKLQGLNKLAPEDITFKLIENLPFLTDVFYNSKINYLHKHYLIFKLDKRVAVFDLEQTLVHSVVNPDKNKEFDEMIEATLYNKKIKIGINYRPYLREALQEISKNYIIIVFSTEKKEYSDIIINNIDPENKIFNFRLFREDCINMKLDLAKSNSKSDNLNKINENESILIKDLRILKSIPLTKIVIIDKSVLSFAFQIDNGIPILPYIDSKTDNELRILVNYLSHLCQYDDIMEENKKVFGLENLLINSAAKAKINNLNNVNYTLNNFCANEADENNESSGLYSYYRTDSGKNEKIEDSDKEKENDRDNNKSKYNKPNMINVKMIEKIEPVKMNDLHKNFIKNNFNSNSSYESNSLLSCLILLNKGPLCDSIYKDTTNTFISSDYSKSDSEFSERK